MYLNFFKTIDVSVSLYFLDFFPELFNAVFLNYYE